jgi:hypothetical protein
VRRGGSEPGAPLAYVNRHLSPPTSLATAAQGMGQTRALFFPPFLFDGGRSIGQAPRGDRLVRGGGSWTVESRRTRLRSDADRLYVRRAINLGLFMDGSTVFLVSVDESNSLEYTLWLRPAIAFAAFMQLACMHRFPRAPAVRTNLVTPCLILAEGSATRDSPMFQRYNQRLRFGFKPT